MNHVINTLFFLCATCCSMAGAKPGQTVEPITIDEGRLKVADDGGLINIADLMILVAQLKKLNDGRAAKKKDLIPYKSMTYSLKELIAFEEQFNSDKQMLTDHERKSGKLSLDMAFNHAVDRVREITDSWRESVAANKQTMQHVVERWCEQRNRNESLVNKWFTMDERTFMKNHIKSLADIGRFVEDLIILMLDVKHTLKKSSEVYERLKAERKKQKESNKPHFSDREL